MKTQIKKLWNKMFGSYIDLTKPRYIDLGKQLYLKEVGIIPTF